MKAKRIFLGRNLPLASAVASRLLNCEISGNDLSNILLVLPGEAARRTIQKELLALMPAGLFLPQMLSPHSLLHYGRQEMPLPDQLTSDILWGSVIAEAEKTPWKFNLVFPGGKFPADPFAGGETLNALRHELVAGGKSINDAAAAMGERGSQLAELENNFCSALRACGLTDPLINDREAAADTAAFAGIKKVVVAAIPDLPSVIKDKLAAIAEKFPDKAEIWIYAPSENSGEYDEFGVPIPEKWEDKSFLCPDIFAASDPADGAKRAIHLAAEKDEKTGKTVFSPDDCAIVLADPAMYEIFADEFRKLTDTDGNPLKVADPSGVPVEKLRICRLLCALEKCLTVPEDFIFASELIRQEDFLRCFAGSDNNCRHLLKALDDFQFSFFPDNLFHAVDLAEGAVKNILQQVIRIQQSFTDENLTDFLRKFLSDITAHIPGNAQVCDVDFSLECDFFNRQIASLDKLPPALIELAGKKSILTMFINRCRQQKIVPAFPDGAITFEGCLELPYLQQKKIIFCGMNDGFFPDRIDLTPFLTDTLRRQLNIRSNRETLIRAICHLEGVNAAKELQVIVLRRDTEGQMLRPSGILFNGSDLDKNILLERCEKLFSDPCPLPKPPVEAGNCTIFLRTPLDYRHEEGKMRLSPTDLDYYLSAGPFAFYWHKILKADKKDYTLCEPDDMMTGTILHKVIEISTDEQFDTSVDMKEVLLKNLDIVLFRRYGRNLPMLIRVFADNMRQRLTQAAKILTEEAANGFFPVVSEYILGGEAGFVELNDVRFHGKIDRIEYNKEKGILRLVDIKTGKKNDIVKSHISAKNQICKFQLPLYVMLLLKDENFFKQFPETANFRTIDCAYINLPQSVGDTGLTLWEADDLAAKMPLFERRLIEVIGEIRDFEKNVIRGNPKNALPFNYFDKKSFPLLLPSASDALPDISWIYDCKEPEKNESVTVKAEEITILEAKRSGSAGKTRCCECPLASSGECSCFHGDCSDCQSFNGFKTFQVISASAGTGKTFSLSSRFIQLLEYGVSPESILAITFTRKAAGEIFDKLIKRLCDMIKNPEKKGNHCRRVIPENFTVLLKKLLSPRQNPLQISTIDSYFMRLLKVFAPEMGVWGNISVVHNQSPHLIREVLRQWLYSLPKQDHDTLRELLKETDPDNSKGFFSAILKLQENLHDFFTSLLRKSASGRYPQLEYSPWQAGKDGLNFDAHDAGIKADILRMYAEKIQDKSLDHDNGLKYKKGSTDLSRSRSALVERLNALADTVDNIISGKFSGKLPKPVDSLFEQFNKNAEKNSSWPDSRGDLSYNASIKFTGELADVTRYATNILRHAIYQIIRKKNLAVFKLLTEFDRIYDEKIRKAGILCCQDMPSMLCSLDDESREVIFGNGDGSMEFRMDARTDHYLFDEFQDTSDIQYMAFDPLLKELFSGGDDRFRSFFCVGDIKQSIFQWRGGNPVLFDYINKQLNRQADSLVKSYRSSPMILNTVNTVFGKPVLHELFESYNHTIGRMHYELHRSAKDLPGHAELYLMPANTSLEDKVDAVINILRQNNALNRGFSVGILVQTNEVARNIGDRIRETAPDLLFSIEGNISPADSMLFNVFKETLILANHPGDSEARVFLEHIAFGPGESSEEKCAVAALTADGLKTMLGYPDGETLDSAVRKELNIHGLAAVAERFHKAFAKKCTLFDRTRLDSLCDIARQFAGTPAEFIEQIKDLGENSSSLKNSIQIMTYHKSKGLEFDIVFMPDIANHGNKNKRSPLPSYSPVNYDDYQYGEPMRHPQWISYMPAKNAALLIPPFKEQYKQEEYDKIFAKCCNLYVAMTRAKHALYMFIEDSNTTATFSPDRLLYHQLAVYNQRTYPNGLQAIFSLGSESWIDQEEIRRKLDEKNDLPPEKADFFQTPIIPQVKLVKEKVITASGEKEINFTIPAGQRFSPSIGKNTGTEIHKLFEKISFIEPDFDEKKFSADSSPETAELFNSAMAKDSPLRQLFTAIPGENAEVWCEKRFIRFDGQRQCIVPGAFDRVVVYRENGKVVKAEIIDYKSDRMQNADDFSVYFPQLNSYRASLAALLDLPEEKIACRICALRLRQIITVTNGGNVNCR